MPPNHASGVLICTCLTFTSARMRVPLPVTPVARRVVRGSAPRGPRRDRSRTAARRGPRGERRGRRRAGMKAPSDTKTYCLLADLLVENCCEQVVHSRYAQLGLQPRTPAHGRPTVAGPTGRHAAGTLLSSKRLKPYVEFFAHSALRHLPAPPRHGTSLPPAHFGDAGRSPTAA